MIRMEYPKFNIEGLRDSEKLSTIKRQLDTLTNNIQLVLESISGDVETLSEFVGNNNEAENSENISTITESITSITETIGELEDRDYIVEQGTSGIWTYRKWNSGIAECWGYISATSTSTSTSYGALYYGAQKTQAFPSGLFSTSPQFVNAQAYDNGNGTQASVSTWSKDSMSFYPYGVHNTTLSIGYTLEAKGRWK